MSVPHPGGDPNANLHYQLKRDVLDRIPEIDAVTFVPNRAEARRLTAAFDPRLDDAPAADPPRLTITWYRQTPTDWFRINYSDPNTGVHAGWHQDEDHPALGPAHVQYTEDGETTRRPLAFDHETPSLVLWEILDHLLTELL